MNRPLWLDMVYINVAMLPPIIFAAMIPPWLGLNGIIGLAAFAAIAIVAVVVWIAMILVSSSIMAYLRGNGESP